jgi:hypothetical protein
MYERFPRLELHGRRDQRVLAVVYGDGRRVMTTVVGPPAVVEAFNNRDAADWRGSSEACKVALDLIQELNSEYWQGTAAERAQALDALSQVALSEADQFHHA